MKKDLKTKFSTRQYMLSRDFEVYYYSDSVIPDVEHHSHDYYEFYFFLEGNITMHIGDASFSLRPGTMVIIPPGMPHHATLVDSDHPYRRFVFWISESFLSSLIGISDDYRYLPDLALRNTYFTHKFTEIEFNTLQGKLFSLIDEIHSDRFAKSAKILISVSDFMISINRMVYEANNPGNTKAESDSLYQSIIHYIETHIDENLSLDIIAEKLYISKFHISHVFTETNGLPLHKYITKKRLEMCRDAILSGQDISVVASSYGFSDYSTFYRAFVKEYGVSPKKYKDEIIRKAH